MSDKHYGLMVYVINGLPGAGGNLPYEQLAEDLEETTECILDAFEFLRHMGAIDYVIEDTLIKVTKKYRSRLSHNAYKDFMPV